ncbi:dihydrolipoamide acetyltransferase family protein [Arthrobacter sp. EPSL27]|uniref:dihydrolipoamide acetyltransferase family protein n=1 Tax=Arthrobacter sp. EPSL27 TaxID=1745378 RepID=UPI00074701A9|nr:dihydrolipoamide acetyltransferase family protein [Arthrobacter sp. EPSL27]KUM37430.1 hypothetical protein AR539_09225 [Arthrobacter sp. EPSL27]
MTALHTFRLPDVGEGLTEAEIIGWQVSVGDTVAINDVLVEIETAKSSVELPSPFAGRIATLHGVPGDTVPVGSVLVTVEAEGGNDEHAVGGPGEEAKPLVLVGTGPSAPADRRRRLGPNGAGNTRSAPRSVPVAKENAEPAKGRATPPARLRAKQLGVDLDKLAKTDGGMITREEIEAAAAGGSTPAPVDTARERRLPIKGVRKVMASAMVLSAFTAPHVTEWLTVDVTATMQMVAQLKRDPRWQGVRVSPLLFVAKALVLAARKHPLINSTWDEANQEVIEKFYVNLGIAAATPRGLLVPNIKDAHTMDLVELASALDLLVSRARSGETTPADMSSGTITITNIGALGVDAGTPILNPGEAAILAFGAVRYMPWVVDGEIVPRQVTQLALSFDHRLVDGELGSRVLTDVGRLLHNPAEAMLYV